MQVKLERDHVKCNYMRAVEVCIKGSPQRNRHDEAGQTVEERVQG